VLRIESRSEVEVAAFAPPADFAWPAWDAAADAVRGRLDPDALDARQYTFDSPHVPRHDDLAAYARPSFPPGRPVFDAAMELTRRIHGEFRFVAGRRTSGRRCWTCCGTAKGVCQDFAHLMIGCLRSLGLPARYVSGYLVTRPPPGKPRHVGADASHAWVSTFVPDVGWVDLDPTNGVVPSDEHITVGWARDYDDLSPVRGVIVGGRGHELIGVGRRGTPDHR
jgi:transglutaminase-like putative cysteine protease